MKRLQNNERGIAAVAILVVLVIASVAGFAAYRLTSTKPTAQKVTTNKSVETAHALDAAPKSIESVSDVKKASSVLDADKAQLETDLDTSILDDDISAL